MASHLRFLLPSLAAICSILCSRGSATTAIPARYSTSRLNRSSFPDGFIFGTASSSYQVN